MKNILLGLSLLTAIPLNAQTEVTNYQPGITEEGITYFLPTTAIHFTITAQRTAWTPGEYCQYAQRYLRLKDVPQTPGEEWVITDIKATPYGVADHSQAYTVKLKSKTLAALVSLAPDGRLLSINGCEDVVDPQLSQPQILPDTHKTLSPADFKTEEILAAGSTAKMAELTAAEIYDIRENRSLLTKGQADFMPKDGEQLKLMLHQLDIQEEALLQLFKGSQKVETHIFTLDYLPAGEVKDEILFRFSKHLGLVKKDNVAGAPYYISVKDAQTLPVASETVQGKNKKNLDVRYRVAGKGELTLTCEGKNIYKANLPFAQFGRTETLGSELFNKKTNTRIYFSPVNGNITKIEGE